MINIAGLTFNHCISLHRSSYSLYGKHLSAYQLKVHLTKIKRSERFAYICMPGSQAIQDIAERSDRAYSLFFSNLKRNVKTSPPTFKAVRRYKSFTLKQAGWELDEKTGRIRLGKKWYSYFQSRKIEGKVKTVTVKRDLVGDIYVYLCCDVQCKKVELKTGKSVGVDFGLKRFLTGSDGHDIDSLYFFKLNARTSRTKCRKLSHKQKGSHNRERARKDLARAYRKLENQRKDFHFKTARNLCEEYAVICLETLNIKGMARLWGRKIHSLGFSEFVKILQYEAMKFGTQIVFVPQYYPSSQLCHVCGYKNEGVEDLTVREWTCPECGAHHDRDRNAAKNINQARALACRGDTIRPEQSGSVEDTRIPRT